MLDNNYDDIDIEEEELMDMLMLAEEEAEEASGKDDVEIDYISVDKNKKDNDKTSLKSGIWEWVKIIVIAVAVALFINFFIIVNSYVPSGSMENTIMTGSRMLGFRLTYLFEQPQRGDIIIFRYPDNEKETFVKRVIGIPGDIVEIKSGVTYVNGEVLDEPYLKETPFAQDFGPYVVPEDSYFVMGDNRNNSSDSRYWSTTNFVTKSQILGKAFFIYWPLSDFGSIN